MRWVGVGSGGGVELAVWVAWPSGGFELPVKGRAQARLTMTRIKGSPKITLFLFFILPRIRLDMRTSIT